MKNINTTPFMRTFGVRPIGAAIAGGLLALLLAGCDTGFFPTADSLKSSAKQALEAKNFSDAATSAQKYIDKIPNDYEGFFFLAQAKAQTGDKNAALVALEQAIKKGLKDDDQISKNVNLEAIKNMVAYKDLMKSSFPGRIDDDPAGNSASVTSKSSASVSITESGGKQIVRAGDVVIEVPTGK